MPTDMLNSISVDSISSEQNEIELCLNNTSDILDEGHPLLFENGGWETAWIDEYLLLHHSSAINEENKNYNKEKTDENKNLSSSSVCSQSKNVEKFGKEANSFNFFQKYFVSKGCSALKFLVRKKENSWSDNTLEDAIAMNIDEKIETHIKEKEMSKFAKFKILFLSFVLIVVTGAAIFNWVDLRIILIRNGAYAEKCNIEEIETKGSCEAQKTALDNSFNIGIVFVKIVGLITGTLLDVVGSKCTGALGLILFASGMICLSFNNVMAGLILLGCSMNPIFNSTVSVANLFPSNKSFIICFLSAAGDLCIIDFLIMRILSDNTFKYISSKVLLLGYLFIVIPQILVVFFIFPKKKFIYKKIDIQKQSKKMEINENREPTVATAQIDENYRENKFWKLNRWQALKTIHFWMFLIFFVFSYFKKVNYMRDVQSFLEDIARGDENNNVIKGYITAYSIILCGATISSLTVGYLADKIGIIFVLILMNIFSCLFSGLSLIISLPVQILTFICFTIFKSFIMSSVYCFIADVYGFKNIGFLTGVQQLFSGLFCLLNIPFQSYGIRGRWWLNHVIMLGLNIIIFFALSYLLFNYPKKEINRRNCFVTSMRDFSYIAAEKNVNNERDEYSSDCTVGNDILEKRRVNEHFSQQTNSLI